jgi:ribosomal protein S18 acetylase RimI-like enzyme
MINIDKNLSIKKFSANYLQQVYKLGLETYGEDEATPLDSLESFVQIAFGQEGYYFGVIEFNQDFIGFLCLYETDESQSILSLSDIVVKKEHRGQKISQYCISALLSEILKNKSYQKVELTVRKTNFPAIKCYENLNFKVLETLPGYYLDKEDAFKMVLSL